jgi:dipeptidase D
MDMVWEKNQETTFDFLTEAIPLYIDGDAVKARGTTLGADNGIGVAMILALMDDATLELPCLEGVFTVDEERGLAGALGLDTSPLKGRMLINLDSEADDEILTSCAGGVRLNYHLPAKSLRMKEGRLICRIAIRGLLGGHSGMDVHKGRANANHLLGRVLHAVAEEMGMEIVSLQGGSKDNAIPREAEAVLAVEGAEMENLGLTVKAFQRYFGSEYAKNDPGILVKLDWLDMEVSRTFNEETTQKIIALLLTIPNGVMSWSEDLEGMPVSSQNLGVVNTDEETVQFSVAARSSSYSKKEELIAINASLSSQIGASMERTGDYPGWSYAKESPLRDMAIRVYENRFGEKPKTIAVHAGVECGIFGDKISGLDMISIGPHMSDVHTPREQLSISSTQKTWAFLTDLLQEV